jgi:hypothetical protein
MKSNRLAPLAGFLSTTLLLSGTALFAQSVSITNAGFENPTLSDGAIQTNTVPGWTAFNGAAIAILNPSATADLTAEAPEGANVGLVTSTLAENGLSQTLSTNFQAGSSYELKVKVANTVFTTDFPGYRVQLVVGGTVLAEDNNSQAVAEDSVVTSTVNYSYNAGSHAGLVGQPLVIRLLSRGLLTGQEVAFDDVQLTTALTDPVANPGGPYNVPFGANLNLIGSASQASAGQSLTTYEWDLNNDGLYDEAITGATPAPISNATLIATHGMVVGANTIKLRVTDDSSPTPKTSVASTTVNVGGTTLLYEPFDDSNTTLTGNTAGDGLSGTWTAAANVAVDPGSLGYGALKLGSGNQVRFVSGASHANAAFNNLSGLLDNGDTLWFSVLHTTNTSVASSNPDAGFAIGTSNLNGGINVPMDSSGNGFGFSIKSGLLRAAYWSGGTKNQSTIGPVLSSSTTYLIVGEMIFSANGTSPDTVNLYLPATNLALGAPVSTSSFNLNQTLFSRISFSSRSENLPNRWDEIRFGVNASDVLPTNPGPPTLASADIVDNQAGAPILESTTVTYTLSFSENMSAASIDAADFDNAGSVPITINSVTTTLNKAFVTLTPTFPGATGTLQLRVKAGATINDFLGTPLNTTAPILDDTIITVNADTVLPTVLSITSPPANTPVYGTPTVPYTVTFDKYFMNDATVTAADFTNAGSATISVGSVTRISTGTAPAAYLVQVTPTSAGTLTLRLSGTVSDLIGNNVTTPVDDDAIYTFNTTIPSKQTIVVQGVNTGVIAGGSGTKTAIAGFDASAADKLVVVLGGEHSFSGNTGGNFDSVTYNSIPLTQAVQEAAGVPTAAIFYLDAPGPAGNLVVTQQNHNNSEYAVYRLKNTAPGIGVVNKATANNLGLITSAPKSMVIACVLNAGPAGGNGAVNLSSVAPLVEDTPDLFGGSAAQRFTSFSAGSAIVSSAAYGLYSFSGAGSTDLLATTVVEIIAADATVGSPYTTWVAGPFTSTLTDPSASLDFDKGGLPTGIEWVVGGDPTLGSDDAGLAPAIDNTTDPDGKFLFTFRRSDAANLDPNTTIAVEYGSALTSWTSATHQGSAANQITITEASVAPGFSEVTVALPGGLAPDGKLFVRLKVVVATP